MTIQQIHYFISVAEMLSFTKAARSHYITQPALSRQIAAMEKELGFLLFSRSKSGIRLTAAGQLLLERFRPISSEYEDAITEATALEKKQNCIIRIGRATSFAFDFRVLQCISSFTDANAKMDFSVSSVARDALLSSISLGEIDAAFSYLDYAHEFSLGENIRHITIGKETILVAVSKISHLAAKKKLTLADMQASRLIAMKLPLDIPPDIAENNRSLQLYLHGNRNPRIVYTNTVEDLTAQVESGVGITFVPQGHPLCTSPLIRLFDAPDKTIQKRVILWDQSNRNPLLQSFLEHAKEFFSEG